MLCNVNFWWTAMRAGILWSLHYYMWQSCNLPISNIIFLHCVHSMIIFKFLSKVLLLWVTIQVWFILFKVSIWRPSAYTVKSYIGTVDYCAHTIICNWTCQFMLLSLNFIKHTQLFLTVSLLLAVINFPNFLWHLKGVLPVCAFLRYPGGIYFLIVPWQYMLS